jgi:Uma2 family endonuclease
MVYPTPKQKDAPIQIQKRRFTVDEYYRMAEIGILSEDDRVELIEGEIIDMAPMGDRHANCLRRLDTLLNRRLRETALVSTQCPIHINDLTEPEPDIALLKMRDDFYAEHPRAQDVLVAIEVSYPSAEYDRGVKLPLYARAGITEAWLVDLIEETIEVYTQPVNGEYRRTERVKRGEPLASLAVPGLELAVNDVLG